MLFLLHGHGPDKLAVLARYCRARDYAVISGKPNAAACITRANPAGAAAEPIDRKTETKNKWCKKPKSEKDALLQGNVLLKDLYHYKQQPKK